MSDEFNPKGTDNDKPTLNGIQIENQSTYSNSPPPEHPDYGTQKVQKRKKVTHSMQTLSLSMTAVAAVSAVVAVGSTVITLDPTEVEFRRLYATDSEIVYDIELINRSDDELTLVISDSYNFINRTKVIEGTEISGKEVDLKPNLTYTVAVKTGNKTIDKREVRVLKTDEVAVTMLYEVTYRCSCGVDGLFHFSLDYIDQNNYWSTFSASLTDYRGTTAYIDFTDDPYADQTIQIVDRTDGEDLYGSEDNPATLVIYCLSSEPDENGVEPEEPVQIELYTAQVLI